MTEIDSTWEVKKLQIAVTRFGFFIFILAVWVHELAISVNYLVLAVILIVPYPPQAEMSVEKEELLWPAMAENWVWMGWIPIASKFSPLVLSTAQWCLVLLLFLGRFYWRILLGKRVYCYKVGEISPPSQASDKSNFARVAPISMFSSILNQ